MAENENKISEEIKEELLKEKEIDEIVKEEKEKEKNIKEEKEKAEENKEPVDTTIQFNDKPKAQEKVKRQTSHKGAFPVGLIVTILALVGLCSIIFFAVKGIDSAVQKNKNYDEYNKFLTPVVFIDPYTFDDITKADMNDLIEISLWSLLKSDISPDKYSTDGTGLAIPKADVEAEFVKLFGTEIKPVHANVEGYGYEFLYDGTAETYKIPLTGIQPIYTPEVVDKSITSDTVVLTVACLSGDAWQQDSTGKMIKPVPDKYLKITLREKDGVPFISAIQNTATPEVAEPESVTETTTENKDLIAQAEQVATESTTVADTSATDTTETTVETTATE